jgi:glycosyltransferase involved in cell wall biosynthesis
MNILHLCTKVPIPAKDGGALATLSFISLLSSGNHNITVLAANTPKHRIDTVPPTNFRLISVDVNTNIRSVALVFNFLFSSKPYNFLRFRSRQYKDILINLIESQKFDIIQLEGPQMAVYLPEIRQYSKAKVLLRAHNVEYKLWEGIAQESPSFLKRFYLNNLSKRIKKFESYVMKKVDGVVAISKIDLEQILSFSKPKKYIVIPFAIQSEGYSPQEKSKSNSIFYIGALDWIPNQTGLIWFVDKVWPLLISKNPDLSFHVAGRNAPLWIAERLKTPGIYFHGEVDNALDFISRYQIMVVPLFSGSGIRIKIMEGMALKKAVVTTSKAIEGLDLFHDKHLLVADSPIEFSRQIERLISDTSLINSLGFDARSYICKEFDTLVLSNRIEEFYRDLFNQNVFDR